MNRKTFLHRWAVGTAAVSLGQLKATAKDIKQGDLAGLSLNSGLKSLFPMNPERLYLNTGGLGPPSHSVIEAMQKQTLKQAVDGETHHGLLEKVREHTAQFLGAEPKEISFTRSASEGNSIIASGLRLQKGDEVIFESHAHPGGSFPWMARQKEHGIRVRIFEPDPNDPEGNLDRIFSKTTDRTRVIQLSHLTAPTGILFDIPSIAREAHRRGIWMHVDGAQSAGMIPIHLHHLECDSYATSGHKWLNGPQETGILYISGDRIGEVGCAHAGAYSSNEYTLPDQFTYVNTAQRHEYGTRDAASIAGLDAALTLQETIGRGAISVHGKQLADKARNRILAMPGVEVLTPTHPEMYNSMLTFRSKQMTCQELSHQLLANHNIRTRQVTERNLNAVRVSFHVYHQATDVDRLTGALLKCLRS